MRTYYLFHVKEECKKYYQEHPKALYELLCHLFYLSKKQGRYGLSFYHQVCKRFDVDILDFYFEGKYQMKKTRNVYQFPKGNIVQIRQSTCIIRTENNFPAIFRSFYYYSRDLFVCDFYNEDYFWLSKSYHELKRREYNKIGVEKIGNI